jgi:hypothetical protein
MTAKLKRNLTIPITAATGLVIAFLLRVILTVPSGITVTSPKGTYEIGVNVVCFWGAIALLRLLVFYSGGGYADCGEMASTHCSLARLLV